MPADYEARLERLERVLHPGVHRVLLVLPDRDETSPSDAKVARNVAQYRKEHGLNTGDSLHVIRVGFGAEGSDE